MEVELQLRGTSGIYLAEATGSVTDSGDLCLKKKHWQDNGEGRNARREA